MTAVATIETLAIYDRMWLNEVLHPFREGYHLVHTVAVAKVFWL